MALDSFANESVALVQGASRGIGLALCEHLLASGRFGRVYATGRSVGRSDGLRQLAEVHGDALVPSTMDVCVEDEIANCAARLEESEGRLDLLVNAGGVLHDRAGGLWPEKRLEDLTPESLERGFRVNAFGPVLMAKHFHRLMKHRRKAVFASLSARVGSIGDNGLGGWYAYRGSKAAQNMFTRTMAIEFSRRARNIVVLALHPGTTDTGLSKPFQQRVPEGKLFGTDFVAERLLGIIDGCTAADSGRFLAWDSEPIPW